MCGCTNCRRVCDTTRLNRLLSLAWSVRKQDLSEPDYIVYHFGVSREDAEFVLEHVDAGCMSHEEFFHFLKESGYAEQPQRRLDRAS